MQQRKLQAQFLTTVMNALVALLSHSSTGHPMVISCKTQFPKYNEFLQGCIDRNKVVQAVSEAGKEDIDILQDEEVLKIYHATNFANTFETQKFNILIIAHRTGLQADTLSKLRRDSFKAGVLSDGQKFMEPIIGTMKNLPATVDNVTKALFRKLLSALILACVQLHHLSGNASFLIWYPHVTRIRCFGQHDILCPPLV